MAIPDDIEAVLIAAGKRVAEARARALREEHRIAKAEARWRRRQARDRTRARPDAEFVWAWVLGPDGRQLLEMATRARILNVCLLGPVWSETAEDADGVRSGSLRVDLLENGLHVSWRMGPSWGVRRDLHDCESFLELVPGVVVTRLAEDIRSGRLWEQMRRGATRGGEVL